MNNIIAILFDTLKHKGISVAEFSKQTGIKQDNVYAWKAKRGNPKADDSVKIQKWIEDNSEKQAKPLPATESFNQNEVSLHSLIESNRVLVETNKVLTELLQQSFSLSSAAQSLPGKLIDPYTLELLARRGVPEYWATIEEGRLKLGSIASALKTVKK